MSKPGNLAILGSTGTIGLATLDVVRRNRELFQVVALGARSNVERLFEQVKEFQPQLVAVVDEEAARRLKEKLGSPWCQIDVGEEALVSAATLSEVHTVVAAVMGVAGLFSTLQAIKAGKHVALANKESLVAGGELITKALGKSPGVLVPVDSEHNSIFQCLHCTSASVERGKFLPFRRIILTASGGPFLHTDRSELKSVSPELALQHPRWKMGPKISIDSATMMNKGLEVIEAAWLFGTCGEMLCQEKIEVLIHPQSIIHGFVEYDDASMITLLSEADMRVPLSFALSYLRSHNPNKIPGPRVVKSGAPFLDLTTKQNLEFFPPDLEKFPALRLCYDTLSWGGTSPAVLNAANEVAVEAFLQRRIGFIDITAVVEETLSVHSQGTVASIEDVIGADTIGREKAGQIIAKLHGSR